jgi:hypothetical protein
MTHHIPSFFISAILAVVCLASCGGEETAGGPNPAGSAGGTGDGPAVSPGEGGAGEPGASGGAVGSTGGSPTSAEALPAGTVVVDAESHAIASVHCSSSDCTVGGYYILARTGADNQPGAFGVSVAFKSNPKTQDYAVQARPQPFCDANSVPQWSGTEANLQVWVVNDQGKREFFDTTPASSGTVSATAFGGPGQPDSAAFADLAVFDSSGNEKIVSANIACSY